MEEDVLLHGQDLLPGVGIVGQVDEVLDRGRVDFFILGRDEQCSHTNELDFGFEHVEDGEVAVHQVNCDVKSLGQQLELGVDADDPVHQDGPDVLVDIALVTHIEAIRLGVLLSQLHVLLDLPAVQADMVDVADGRLVDLADLRVDILFDPLLIVGELGVGADDLGEFVARA